MHRRTRPSWFVGLLQRPRSARVPGLGFDSPAEPRRWGPAVGPAFTGPTRRPPRCRRSRPPGSGRAKDIVIDGEQGRHFSCAVKPSGDTFAVTGDMNVPGLRQDTKMPLPIPTRITLSIPFNRKRPEPAPWEALSVADNEGAGAALQSTTCLFSVKADATTNKPARDRRRKDLGKRHLHRISRTARTRRRRATWTSATSSWRTATSSARLDAPTNMG